VGVLLEANQANDVLVLDFTSSGQENIEEAFELLVREGLEQSGQDFIEFVEVRSHEF